MKQSSWGIIDAIHSALLMQGMSQAELARRIGVQPTKIGQYLAGKTEPRSGTIDKMCWVLGVEHVAKKGGIK